MAEHTPGSWRWKGNTSTRSLWLSSDAPMRPIVMDFVRWGMNSAAPRFRNAAEDVMQRADEHFIRPQTHNPWIVAGLSHPDAHLIAAAPDLYTAAKRIAAGYGWPENPEFPDWALPDFLALLDAIAKAEGRA